MVTASVGFQCPECARSGAKQQRLVDVHRKATAPYVTYALIGVNVAVFIVGGKQQAAAMIERAQFTATALIDPSRNVQKQYDIKAVPYLLVLGPDGHARTAYRGEQDEGTLRSALASAR